VGVTVTGIVWYTEIAYYLLKDKFDDRAELPDTYGEWLQSAESLLWKLRSEGLIAVPINLEPSVFLKWCRKKGLKLNAQARSRYATEGAERAFEKKT